MPALSPTMEMGTIVRWNKKEGELVNAGDIICEIETDKATVDFEAQDEGYLAKILMPEGSSDVEVGTPIFIMVEEEESIDAFGSYSAVQSPIESKSISAEVLAVAPVVSNTTALPAAPTMTPVSISSGERVFASPLARKIARESNLVLTTNMAGSGPNGRLIKSDIEQFLVAGIPQAPTMDANTSSSSNFSDHSISDYARRLAEQLTRQKFDVPHYHLSANVTLDKLLQVRDEINTMYPEENVSVNDFLIKAAALAMHQVPMANAAWMDSFIRQYHSTDINWMISVDGHMVAPLLRATETKNVREISRSCRQVLDKVTQGEVTQDDMMNGTFSISNVGMYGVQSLSAVVSPNQSCALGLGAIEKVVVPSSSADKFQVATKMQATLACDHRVIDGAVGAQWLGAFKQAVENPMNLLL